MKRVIVIGCPGSGKTTFAQKLAGRSGVPLFHLDAIWHKPDRTHIPRDEFDVRLGQILALDQWIIDGNYSRTLERRMAACDTVIFFDLPTEVCLDGAIARLGQKRPDMPWIDTALDPNLKTEIERFATENRPAILDLIDRYKGEKQIVIFESRAEADAFLQESKDGTRLNDV